MRCSPIEFIIIMASAGSTYVNYADAAKSYDNARFTAGVDIVLGGFAGSKTGVPLHQQKILDNGVSFSASLHVLASGR
jgi:hypothetical protein